MSEYRDELGSAHRRIAQLELELTDAKRAAPRRSRARSSVYAAGAFGALLVALGVGAIFGGIFLRSCWRAIGPRSHSDERRTPVPITAQPPPQPTKRIYASWYPNGALPELVDVDGDGTKDIVGLFWRSGQANPLYAAAIDGKTFEVKWSAGPYPSQWNSSRTHFTIVDRRAVVTDSQDNVRVLALADGKVEHELVLAEGATSVCALDERPGFALLSTPAKTDTPSTSAVMLGLESGAMTPAPSGVHCVRPSTMCKDVRSRGPCFHYGTPEGAPIQGSKAGLTRTFVEDDLFVAAGAQETAPRAPFAFGWKRGAKVPAWRETLAVGDGELHYGVSQHAMRDGKLFTLYQKKAGGSFRIVAHAASDGSEIWAADVPRSIEGSYVTAFGAQGTFVLAVVDHTVHLFDAATGRYLKGLDASTI